MSHKVQLFKVYNSVVFTMSTESCSLIIAESNISITPKQTSCCRPSLSGPTGTSPPHLPTTNLLSLRTCPIHEIIQRDFASGPFHLAKCFQGSPRRGVYQYSSHCPIVFLSINIPHCVCLFVRWWTFGLLPLPATPREVPTSCARGSNLSTFLPTLVTVFFYHSF